MTHGILIAAMDFSNVAEDEFNDWYDTEHIPERQRVPGFHSYAILPIGYPMGRFGPVARGPLAEVVYLDGWSKPYPGI